MEIELFLDAARIITVLGFLFYASWRDHKTREVSNTVWIILAPAAFTMTFIQLFLYQPSQLQQYAISFGLMTALSLILFYSGGFGGADSKALMCLALALPFYPNHLLSPLAGEISPISQAFFPITVFSNSVLFAAATAVYILLRNLLWHWKNHRKIFEQDHEKESIGKKALVLITGYKAPLKRLKEKWHWYPLEDVEEKTEDGIERKLIVLPRDEGRDAIVDRLEHAVKTGKIQDGLWATPGLPMLVFVTTGLIIALVFGDVIWFFIRLLLH